MLTFLNKFWNLIKYINPVYRSKQREKINKFFAPQEYYKDYPILPPVDPNKTQVENIHIMKNYIQECVSWKQKKTLEAEKL